MNAARILGEDFADIFAGVPDPARPGETERQSDQRTADELRAARYAAACRSVTQDEE